VKHKQKQLCTHAFKLEIQNEPGLYSQTQKKVFVVGKHVFSITNECFLKLPPNMFFSVRPPAAREGGRQAFNYANPNGNLQTTFQQKCPTAVAHSKAIYTPPSSKVVNRQKQLCNTDHLPAKVLNWPESNTSALHTFQQKQATQGQQKACVSCSSTGNKEAKEAKEGRACHFSFYGNT